MHSIGGKWQYSKINNSQNAILHFLWHRVLIAGIHAKSTHCRVKKRIRINATLASSFQGHFQGQKDEKLSKVKN